MQPMSSPLRLDRYFLKELSFKLYEGFDRRRIPDDEMTTPNLRVTVVSAIRNPEHELQWRFELSLELLEPEEGTKFPYKVNALMVGYFTIDERYPKERAERLVRTNGPAVLYSSARELIASVTGRSPYSSLLIPCVTFLQPEKAEETTKTLPEAEKKQLVGSLETSKKAAKKRTSKKKGTSKKRAE
jgi:preprotein translocase subunit SecB